MLWIFGIPENDPGTQGFESQTTGPQTNRVRRLESSFAPKEAWGYMSDFQIFGVAADAQQIRGLYDAGGGKMGGIRSQENQGLDLGAAFKYTPED